MKNASEVAAHRPIRDGSVHRRFGAARRALTLTGALPRGPYVPVQPMAPSSSCTHPYDQSMAENSLCTHQYTSTTRCSGTPWVVPRETHGEFDLLVLPELLLPVRHSGGRAELCLQARRLRVLCARLLPRLLHAASTVVHSAGGAPAPTPMRGRCGCASLRRQNACGG